MSPPSNRRTQEEGQGELDLPPTLHDTMGVDVHPSHLDGSGDVPDFSWTRGWLLATRLTTALVPTVGIQSALPHTKPPQKDPRVILH